MIRSLKHLLRRIIEGIARASLEWRLSLTYRVNGLEGVDRILALCDSDYVGYILTKYGANVGADHDLHSPLLVHNACRNYSNLTIGKQCHLGKEVFLDLRDKITIEDRVTISMRVTVLTHTDVGHSPLRVKEIPERQSPVVIEMGAYVGAGATILQGVTIGECTVIGAGAVVVADVPPYSVAVGIPAKVVRSLTPTGLKVQEPA